jgi:hypothetical protein
MLERKVSTNFSLFDFEGMKLINLYDTFLSIK